VPISQTQTVTIALSGTVSGAFAIAGVAAAGIWSPVITSAQVYLRGSYDTTSANFVPVYLTTGASRFVFSAGPGSAAMTIPADIAEGFTHLKVETSVAQSAIRNFIVITKP